MSTQPLAAPTVTDIPSLSIEDMTPSTRHFVSLQSIHNRIHKAFPSLTTQQFRGWHGRRKLIDAGAIIHGRVTSKTDNFLEICFLHGSSPPAATRYELKVAKAMRSYLSEQENEGGLFAQLYYVIPRRICLREMHRPKTELRQNDSRGNITSRASTKLY